MVDTRFELTTNDPRSVYDAVCEGISPLAYWLKVNQSPTQTKPYNMVHKIPYSSSFTGWTACDDNCYVFNNICTFLLQL